MGMRLNLSTSLKMRQELRLKLAPAIIQSIEILQKSVQELEEHVHQEMLENPTIELVEVPPERQAVDDNGDLVQQPLNGKGEYTEKEAAAPSEVDYNRISTLGGEWSDWGTYNAPRRRAISDGEDRKLEAMRNTAARAESLQDILYHQYCLQVEDQEYREIAENLVYNIDDNGYLTVTTQEVLPDMPAGTTAEDVELVIREIQALEPPGVGARDMRECLLLQLPTSNGDNELPRRLIDRHLDDVRRNKLPRIARELGVSIEKVKELIAEIAHLNPRPGLVYSAETPQYVMPDVIVEKMDGVYQVRLVSDRIPRISVSPDYEAMLESRAVSDEEKNFIRRKIESATQLRDAIEQREHTLLRVVRKVFKHQEAYLDGGPEYLKPLKMVDVADELGIHVSTVSRALANKHAQTPHGVTPLRRFFTGGVTSSDSGDDISTQAVRIKIQEIIEGEDKAHPLADDALAKELQERFGLAVARRTVTKYRKAIGVPSSRQRRQY